MRMDHLDVDTPFGRLSLTELDGAITSVRWGARAATGRTPLLTQAARELREYAQGTREAFDVPLRVDASDFQQAVCVAIQAIPFGETRSYGEIAKDLGVTAQAVGQACGANPIPIFIPCHRVLGADGRLTGFSGGDGIETKVALLRHERAGGFLI